MTNLFAIIYTQMAILAKSTPQLDKWITWGETQLFYILYLIMFVIIAVLAFKRAWLLLFGALLALAFIAIFVNDPYVLVKLSQWLAQKIN